jgi:hypothetical protein
MELKGSKRVEIVGIDDKRQITAVFCGTLAGEFLPLQLIYQGKTKASLPPYKFPSDWHVTFTPNHWSNEDTTKESYITICTVKEKRPPSPNSFGDICDSTWEKVQFGGKC